mmetsp:Transcript_54962/g.76171  ORF Transcript_54962/g.76171 Transcript_54962/m.76171 type:complete len:101 (+) Transcript_54962:335-637(+)
MALPPDKCRKNFQSSQACALEISEGGVHTGFIRKDGPRFLPVNFTYATLPHQVPLSPVMSGCKCEQAEVVRLLTRQRSAGFSVSGGFKENLWLRGDRRGP